MTFGPLFAHGFTNYTYDARDRLTGAGGVSYGYDAENNRTSLTTVEGTTEFVLDPHAGGLPRVLIRENPDQSTTTYVYGIGLLYEVNDSDEAAYYHFDHLGSTVALTNEVGEVTDRMEYSPWGHVTHREGETDTPFLFVGQHGVQTDPEGLLYMRARYYSPELRRFLNADPIGFGGGLNWYAYANGNPMMFVDATGFYGEILPGTNPGAGFGVEGGLQFLRGLGDQLATYGSMIASPIDTYNSFRQVREPLTPYGGSLHNFMVDVRMRMHTPYGRGTLMGDAVVARGVNLTTSAATSVGRTAVAARNIPAPNRGPDFIVTPRGTAHPVPSGATGPTSTRAPGMQYTGGSGGPGMDSRTSGVRFMDATRHHNERVI